MFQRTLTCGLLVLVPAPLFAQNREISPDVLQTFEARKALLGDKDLGPLNLGVKVTNRVAVLWGPVPSGDLSRRAIALLTKMPGLIAVKNELEIDPDLAQPPLFLPETLPQESHLPVRGQAPFSASTSHIQLPKKVADPFPPQATLTTMSGKRDAVPAPAAQAKKAAGKSANEFPPVVVPPTPIPGMPDHREIDIVLPSLRIPVAEPQPVKSLEETIAALQKESRFAGIRVQLHNGIVTLTANADQTQTLYELARRVSALPGIERVIVQEK
jgi:hypothetical protein